MKRNDLLEEIQKEILTQSPKNQAKAINVLDHKYVSAIVSFLFENGQDAFLPYLSVSVLMVIVRKYFSFREDCFFQILSRTEQENEEMKPTSRRPTDVHKRFTQIVRLPKFPQVWNRVCNDMPCAAFQFVPIHLMRPVLNVHISDIVPTKNYKELMKVIEMGTHAEKLFAHALISNEEDVPLYQQKDIEDYKQLLKSLGNVVENNWLRKLFKVLPVSYKLSLLYGRGTSDANLERIKTYCLAQGSYISDDRIDPLPLALAFLDFEEEMESWEYKRDEHLEDLVDDAIGVFVKNLVLFVMKIGPSKRTADILDFFNMITYKGRGHMVEHLPMEIIVMLFKENRCLWMKKKLSENQKVALGSKGSIGAVDAHKVLHETSDNVDLLPKTVSGVKKLTLREKMQVIAMG